MLVIFLLGMVAPVGAQVPQPIPVPAELPDPPRGQLIQRRTALLDERDVVRSRVAANRAKCQSVLEKSAAAAECTAAQGPLKQAIEAYAGAVRAFNDHIAAAILVERKRLEEIDRQLSAAIERDLTAIRRLGFSRRAEDFEEWEKLAEDAQKQLEDTVKGEVINAIASAVQDRMLHGFKKFDAETSRRWIAYLEKRDPPMVETAAILRRIASLSDSDRARLAIEAKYLVKAIENMHKVSPVRTWTDAAPVMLDMICQGFPTEPIHSQCKAFRAISKITVAAAYNNVTRRVAITEVQSLTKMTEDQLKALEKINELLVKHVRERNDVRTKISALPVMPGH